MPALPVEILLLAHAEADLDGINFRNRGQQRARAATHQVARFNLRLSDQSFDRRIDPGVAELDIRRVRRGARGLHRCGRVAFGGERVIQLLPGDGVLQPERAKPVGVLLRFVPGCLRLRQRALGLRQRGFERPVINGVKQRVADHRGAFGKVDRVQKAFDPSANLDVARSERLPDVFLVYGLVARHDFGDHHRERRQRRGWRFLTGGQACHQQQCQCQQLEFKAYHSEIPGLQRTFIAAENSNHGEIGKREMANARSYSELPPLGGEFRQAGHQTS